MVHRAHRKRLASASLFGLSMVLGAGAATAAPFMIVGNDEKLVWDDDGKPVLSPAGKDSVLIVDLAKPEEPKIVANLPIKNSVVGPPVNLAINPAGTLALVADSVDVQKDGDALKQLIDNKLYVVDLTTSPPKVIDTLTVGKMPSGLDISPDGKMALVALRGDNAIAVLSIAEKTVKLVDTVPMNDIVSAVVFTPDGKHALSTKFNAGKVSVLDIADGKVSYNKLDLPTGPWPYNVVVVPGGKIALTADNGNSGASDGNIDTVSVVDLEAKPPRIIDRVVVNDGPEGIAVSPKGNLAAAAILRGGNSSKKAFFYEKAGSVNILKIDGKKVTKIKDIKVGGLPEPIVFTPDGKYLLVGNYLDKDFSILKVDGTKVTDTGKRWSVPGHPASARMSVR